MTTTSTEVGVAIIGSRRIGEVPKDKPYDAQSKAVARAQAEFVEKVVARLVERHGRGARYVSGGAHGVDRIAAAYLRRVGIEPVEHLPDWNRLGRRAAFVRNHTIVNDATIVVAIWDGYSRGTMHGVEFAVQSEKQVFLYVWHEKRWTSDPSEIRKLCERTLRPENVSGPDDRWMTNRQLAVRAGEVRRRRHVRRM